MDVITKKRLIETAAQRWREEMDFVFKWAPRRVCSMMGLSETHAKLNKLSVDASEDDVAAIVGNHKWTENLCQECGIDAPLTIIFAGGNPKTKICMACLTKATALAEIVELEQLDKEFTSEQRD